MQLLSLTLYNHDGEARPPIRFKPGELNIVTGESQTGKSALLTIVEYCLGRDSMRVPVGPITDTVAWYATLWQLDEGRAFIARPAPASGRASTQQAMLEFGTDLEPPDFGDLMVNTDSTAMREQLGRRIGIEENLADPGPWSLRKPFEANLGHATLLCLQSQNEIASAGALFHRQGEQGIEQALKDTIPYFLGAVPRDQALMLARLRDARRALQRISSALQVAELSASTIDAELSALLEEARAVGLVPDVDIADRAELVRTLQGARVARLAASRPVLPDQESQDRRRRLDAERRTLRDDLRRTMADRELLLDQRDGEGGYEHALNLQVGRLESLNLLGQASSTAGPDNDSATPENGDTVEDCPACGHALSEPDPTASALRTSLIRLRDQLGNMSAARPAQRVALQTLDDAATSIRERLRGVEAALDVLLVADRVAGETPRDSYEFIRGRIDATLGRVTAVDDIELRRLREQEATAAEAVAALESELDNDDDREQLTSRLVAVGRDMTTYADRLQLEHSGDSVRLDLSRLTVVTDTERGPAPLFRIGSAANAIGYHLVAHLALHRYLVRQGRPVPRFLMIDQPSQAYYPSEVGQRSGVPTTDTDREAVRRMFLLIHDVVAELTPNMQVIISDHANLPDPWFQESVVENWRDGRKLIPIEWLT